ncbi:MAG: 50S ribosomal protein L29 [Planctomycetaceae bacterium]|jgi:large subunit ribosomal protein L29|nr:50S ribosomal protein L29 [Planctomycetaceae bacterium]
MKAQELRDMTNEDLQQTLADTSKRLFELRVQAQAERLDAPSEIRRNRRLIARIKTIQTERTVETVDAGDAE